MKDDEGSEKNICFPINESIYSIHSGNIPLVPGLYTVSEELGILAVELS